MRKIFLTGRLTADPAPGNVKGYNTAKFGLAVNNGKKSDDGSFLVDYYNCTAWGQLADRSASRYKKGQLVAVSGDINQNPYVDRNGSNRVSMEVRVDTIEACAPASTTSVPTTQQNVGHATTAPPFAKYNNDDFLAGLE